MAHIQKREGRFYSDGQARHQLRWVTPDGEHRTRSFRRRADALREKSRVEADLSRGQYVDPSRATVAEVSERWLATKRSKKSSTLSGYRSILDNHILPKLGDRQVAKLRPTDVEAFVSGLTAEGAAPGTVRNVFFTLQAIIKVAIRDGHRSTNPAEEVELPASEHEEMHFLNARQVDTLADAIPPEYRTLVLLTAYCGLRAGEVGALRVRHLDLLHSRILVRESCTYVKSAGYVFGSTKNKQTRTVGVPRFLLELLEKEIDGRGPDAFVFIGPDGGHVRHNSWYTVTFKPAVRRANLPPGLRFHDLRHTCASFLILKGAHPKEVCDVLGHSTIQITMDRYGHMFPERAAYLATALDDLHAEAAGQAPMPAIRAEG